VLSGILTYSRPGPDEETAPTSLPQQSRPLKLHAQASSPAGLRLPDKLGSSKPLIAPSRCRRKRIAATFSELQIERASHPGHPSAIHHGGSFALRRLETAALGRAEPAGRVLAFARGLSVEPDRPSPALPISGHSARRQGYEEARTSAAAPQMIAGRCSGMSGC